MAYKNKKNSLVICLEPEIYNKLEKQCQATTNRKSKVKQISYLIEEEDKRTNLERSVATAAK